MVRELGAKFVTEQLARVCYHAPDRCFAAVAVSDPAKLGHEGAAVRLIEFELLWIRVAKTIVQAFLPELREGCSFCEEVCVGALQVFKSLL